MTKKRISGIIYEGRALPCKNQTSSVSLRYGSANQKGDFWNIEKRKSSFKSRLVKSNNNPIWREGYDITIDSSCSYFKVEVYENVSFVGQTLIDITNLKEGQEIDEWYKLTPKKSKSTNLPKGEIRIKIILTGESSIRKLTEEEELSLDEIRTGNIDYIMKALVSCSESLAVQESALSALFKWAEKSSVADKILALEKLQDLFNIILKALKKFSKSTQIQFYGVATFTSFTKLMEAKDLFSEEIANTLVISINKCPIDLSDSNRIYYTINCIMSLANICTYKYETHYASEMEHCRQRILNSGALEAIMKQLKINLAHDVFRKCALSFLLKCVANNDQAKEKFYTLDVPKQIFEIGMDSYDTMTQWIALDILHHFVKGSHERYIEYMLGTPNLIARVFHLSFVKETIQYASLCTSIVYFIDAVIENASKDDIDLICQLRNMRVLASSLDLYKRHIPEDDQKLYLPLRLLHLFHVIGSKYPEHVPILVSNENIELYILMLRDYKGVKEVLKLIDELLQVLISHPIGIQCLKISLVGISLQESDYDFTNILKIVYKD